MLLMALSPSAWGALFINDDYADGGVLNYYRPGRTGYTLTREYFDGDYRMKLGDFVPGYPSPYHGALRSRSTTSTMYYYGPVESALSVDIYAPNATTDADFGLWGQVRDGHGSPRWPVMHYYRDSSTNCFRVWDNAVGWVNVALPSGFTYEDWHTLTLAAGATNWRWYVDGALLYSEDATPYGGTDYLEAGLLLANTNYAEVYFDNYRVTEMLHGFDFDDPTSGADDAQSMGSENLPLSFINHATRSSDTPGGYSAAALYLPQDGDTNYVDTVSLQGDNLRDITEATVSFWIKMPVAPDDNPRVFDAGLFTLYLEGSVDPAAATLYTRLSPTQQDFVADATFDASNKWVFVA
jgi:hypothetical protein